MLELYQFESCPYCVTVRRRMTELGLSFVAHNPRRNPDRMREMLSLGGKDQVPFLVDRDEDGEVQAALYESEAIKAYLTEHYGQ